MPPRRRRARSAPHDEPLERRVVIALRPALRPGAPLRVLCIGAHSDDIEIGCGATLLHWLATYRAVDVTWVVLSAPGTRRKEAERSARALLRRARRVNVLTAEFRDGYMPAEYADVKAFVAGVRDRHPDADVVLTHRLEDRHQDHGLLADLTWNSWRDHVVLEYEIAKYEGDLAPPNVYVPIPTAIAERKVRHLVRHFRTQLTKPWFTAENFTALMRLRGLECRSPSGFAEAFHARKLVL
jgi:LmbE family N-acetylglucosaminyl deacetylase